MPQGIRCQVLHGLFKTMRIANQADVVVRFDGRDVMDSGQLRNLVAQSPIGSKHRLANPGKIPLEIIEVQSGSYLGEDDIVRFEDRYWRAPKD